MLPSDARLMKLRRASFQPPLGGTDVAGP